MVWCGVWLDRLQYLKDVGLICLLFCCVSDEDEENQDTVEQILKCIIENEGEKYKNCLVVFWIEFSLT